VNDAWQEQLAPRRERELERLRSLYRHLPFPRFTPVYSEPTTLYRRCYLDIGNDDGPLNRAEEIQREQIAYEAFVISSPHWLPTRPGRRMPPIRRIAEHWNEAIECFRCGAGGNETTTLERAHLVDRARGGLDTLANIVLLCSRCHSRMKRFGPNDAVRALRYVFGSELVVPWIDDSRITMSFAEIEERQIPNPRGWPIYYATRTAPPRSSGRRPRRHTSRRAPAED